MAHSRVGPTLAETQEALAEKEKLHASLSSYHLGKDVKDYVYQNLGVPSPQDDLRRDKKRFRLLNLMSGFLDNPTVYCEIFEVEVDIATDHVYRVHNPGWVTSKDRTGPTNSISYEAMSWRWGDELHDNHAIIIKTEDGERKKRVSYTLGLALKYLRHETMPRVIWIDALCINQSSFDERSSQVAMMDRLYTGASQICVWLGQDDSDSRKAIKFIKEEINQLRDFDKLCKNPKHAEKWRALLGLMQRDWFSRRWVVQELALARKAEVHCGPDKIDWRELAIAIELFVEVEAATHRLSELMQKDEQFSVIPNLFEHISELGASLLVTETSKIFRDYKRESDKRPLGLPHLSEEGPGRRSLLSLEYLVTSLSIFDCGRPHDFVYALVAISRDAFPSPPTSLAQRSKEALVTEVMKGFVERKPFPLDYDIPYPDVARDFIEFTIQRHVETGKDEEKALDILCRPWSKDWRPGDGYFDNQQHEEVKKKRLFEERKADQVWKTLPKTKRDEFKFKPAPLEERQEDDRRTMEEWRLEAQKQGATILSEEAYKKKWDPWFRQPQGEAKRTQGLNVPATRDSAETIAGIALPSWVADVTRAPFDIFPHPGVEMTKMGRKNADPLVGSLDNRTGTYNAAQSKKQASDGIKFKKRARLGHYSLYVRGFRFDKVDIVDQVSQQGAIPASWLKLGEWDKSIRPNVPGADPGIPPDAFWRTLVADRGMHNQNPPYYYSRACRETIMKGALRSNAVDTTALIYNERNSIIAEFCRRTQCVIWNRAMIKTQNGHLGLVSPDVRKGDLVCIIYGCTVPVILRKAEKLKTPRERKDELKDDYFETFKRCFKKCLQRRARRFEYSKKLDEEQKRVREDLSFFKAKDIAQKMLEEAETWEKLAKVKDGGMNEAGDQKSATTNDGGQVQRIPEADLRFWLKGDPWQKCRDNLATQVDDCKAKAKSALLEWRRKRSLEKAQKEDEAVKKWLKAEPTKWNQDSVSSWLGEMPKAMEPGPEGIRMWRWLHDDCPNQKFLDSKHFGRQDAALWLQWWKGKPQGFASETKDESHEPVEIDIDQLDKDIKRWREVKRSLDGVVGARETEKALQQQKEMEEELKRWEERSKAKPERMKDRESKAALETKDEPESKEEPKSEDIPKRKEGPKAQVAKRWSQMPLKSSMELKQSIKSSLGSGHLSSDEESDEGSADEGGDWKVESEASDEQHSDSESDDEGGQDASDNGRQAQSSKRLGKKERQNLADERDPFRHYKFLGEAYIHGMMEGEAVSQSFYKKKPEHLFEIR